MMNQPMWTYVPVEVAGYRVAIPVQNVLAVRPLHEFQVAGEKTTDITAAPEAAEQFRLIDLRQLFGSVQAVIEGRDLCVVIGPDNAENAYGLLVDAVHSVESVAIEHCLDWPQLLSSVATIFDRVVRLSDSVILVLAINELANLPDDVTSLAQGRDIHATA